MGRRLKNVSKEEWTWRLARYRREKEMGFHTWPFRVARAIFDIFLVFALTAFLGYWVVLFYERL